MSESGFEDAWRADLEQGTLGVQLVEVLHPLELYVGSSDLGSARLQIRTSMKPAVPKLAEVVVADLRESGDRWLLTLTLQDPRFVEVFIRLVVHVVDRTRSASSEAAALAVMGDVLELWRRLMTPPPARRLSLDALRGLVGELWYLIHHAAARVGSFEQALAGWNGPLGNPQDFWYPESGAIEMKAIGPGMGTIQISSAEQLDFDPLVLVVATVPQVPDDVAGASNLVGLVHEACHALANENLSDDELHMRLRHLGVDLSDQFYVDSYFEVREVCHYDVTPEFPALRSSVLPGGVEGVKYQLKLASIEPFKAGSETFTQGA